eukprot:TRINITY_DN9417_c0_g1_i1.p1 TRINITY_DN9417_c0_g1~~TRINITY_DN9417_c0_g1_i1.p1  ORF type:complete len:587 (+),score=105.46 TRINITY_DN9417_c0_g1_i1:111-1871(+)
MAMSRSVAALCLGVVFLLSLTAAGGVCQWLGSVHAYGDCTQGQVALSIALCGVMALWITVEAALKLPEEVCQAKQGFQAVPTQESNGAEAQVFGAVEEVENEKENEAVESGTAKHEAAEKPPAISHKPDNWQQLREVFEAAQGPLRGGAECTSIFAVVFLCDRTAFFKRTAKVYDPKQFWAVCGLLLLIGLASLRKVKDVRLLPREQTDEWKGWMQFMFVLYHYFAEKEVYNAIRIFIAAYVWMTGYGNYHLYIRGKAFTTRRTLQMLFRLNFLGALACLALANEYLLYYICGMHTLFTVFVLAALYIRADLNSSMKVIWIKIAACAVLTAVLYDGPDFIFRGVFGTLPIVRQMFAFHDPLHPEFKDEMHEWHFRSGLDRYNWVIGMMCAALYTYAEDFYKYLYDLPLVQRLQRQAGLLAVLAVPTFAWWWFVFSLDKLPYNVMHPFTSFWPLVVFIVLRNFTTTLREYYMSFFAYFGTYTLETYIMQFHVWMATTGPNGSPKKLLSFLPDWVPYHYWANLAVATAIYLFLSVRFQHVTTVIRDFFFPEDMRSMLAIWTVSVCVATCCWLLAPSFMGEDSVIAGGI